MFHWNSFSARAKVDFTRNLAVMLKSGVGLNEALAEIAEHEPQQQNRAVITRVREVVESGLPLSNALEKYPKYFECLFVSFVRAGEESGTLQENLEFLALWLNRQNILTEEVRSSLLYPKIVFSGSILLGGCLALFVLPKLIPVFSDFNMEVPLVTKLLIAGTLFIQSYWFWCMVGFGIVIATWIVLQKNQMVRYYTHRTYLYIPVIGGLIKNYQLAIITYLSATLLRSGLTLNASLLTIASATTNECYRATLHTAYDQTLEGQTLSSTLRIYPNLFPPTVTSVIAIGEHSGALVDSCAYLADFYSTEVTIEAKRLPTIIEPVLLVCVASIVGFVAIAIILPIYTLTGNIIR